jgi:hypothetical protein
MSRKESDFILARYNELIDKVVKAETRRRDMQMELDFVKASFMALLQKPVVINLTDEQLNKLAGMMTKQITEYMMRGETVN